MLTSSFLNIRFVFLFNVLAISSICANTASTPNSHSTVINTSINKDFDDLLAEANVYFNQFNFEKAIELYSRLLKQNEQPSIHILQNLADSYFNLSKYSEAGIWYTKLYEIQLNNFNESNFIKLIQCLKSNRNIRKADELLLNYYKDKAQLKTILTQKKHLNSLGRKNEKYAIFNLDFNSEASDFGPTLSKDGLLFISSREKANATKETTSLNHETKYKLFKIWPEDSGANTENYSGIIEASKYAPAVTFSRDSKTVYFTKNIEGSSNVQILRAAVRNNALTDVEVLSFNNKNYSCKHPSLSADEKYLYFSSDMPGGFGESDIYKVALNANGDVLSAPINLGPKINTAGREEYPFVEGQQIYFSSDAHYGMGGLDIFSSQIISDLEYSIPLNLGTPVNSSMDDFSFIAERSRNNAYFASNRPGGKGGNDIYHLVKNKTLTFQEYSGYVRNQITNEPIANAHIQISSIINEVKFTFQTDANGYYNLKLPSNNYSKLTFYKKNYIKNQVGVKTSLTPTAPSKNNTIYLTPSNKTEVLKTKSTALNFKTAGF